MTKRLEVLQSSLVKKEAALAAKLEQHFHDVASANGQPLNDKRNGGATLKRWERQNDAIREAMAGIERTKEAIQREEYLIASVSDLDLPTPIRAALESGEITQWRKHPNRFFVRGVDKARIVWDAEKRTLGHCYANQCSKEQFPAFRDTYNRLRKELAVETAKTQGE